MKEKVKTLDVDWILWGSNRNSGDLNNAEDNNNNLESNNTENGYTCENYSSRNALTFQPDNNNDFEPEDRWSSTERLTLNCVRNKEDQCIH